MGSDSSAQYIHMFTVEQVQHLIEECIVFRMSKEECMEALDRHANINPVITSTVWKELEKENKEFFEGYTGRKEREEAPPESAAVAGERIQKLLLDSPRKDADDSDR